MADVTPVYGWPIPTLTDPPDAPQQFSDLADAIEATIGADVRPIGDSSNSLYLTGSDINFTANDNKNILTTDITLTRDQWVILSGRALFQNQTAGASGLVGIYIDLGGGTPIQELTSGNIWVGKAGDITERMQLVLPPHSVFLTVGTHTIRLRGNRDATVSTHAAQASQSTQTTSHPCYLGIIV